MRISWQRFDGEGVVAEGGDLEGALGPRTAEGFLWLQLADPDPEGVRAVDAHLSLPELAVEDVMAANQRPKLERYDDVLFAVLRPATYQEERDAVVLGEVHVFAGPDHAITVRHDAVAAADLAGGRLQDPDLLAMGPVAVLYAVADQVVDDYQPVVAGLEADIEEIELAVFDDGARPPTQRMYGLMRQVVDFHRACASLQRPMDELARGAVPGIDADLQPRFRDVADHLRQATERLEGLRQLLDSALQANLSLISLQENRDQRRISAWAAVALVPTIVGGVWGMNVGVPFEGTYWGFIVVISVMAAASGVVWWRLHRNDWL